MVANSQFTPHSVCDQLLNQLKQTQLHFFLSETPYSVKIDIKKRFVKELNPDLLPFVNSTPKLPSEAPALKQLCAEKDNLEKYIDRLKAEKATFVHTISTLEEKLEKAEAEAYLHCKEKMGLKRPLDKATNESDVLKTVVKNNNIENNKLKHDLDDSKKTLKKKEKETITLESKSFNQHETINRLKGDIKELNKTLKKYEKKAKHQKPVLTDINHNLDKSTKKPTHKLSQRSSFSENSESSSSCSSLITSLTATSPGTYSALQTNLSSNAKSPAKSLQASSAIVSTLPTSMVSHWIPSTTNTYFKSPISFSSMVSHYVKLYPPSTTGLSPEVEEALERMDRQFKNFMKGYFGNK